jgi:hypothetical protein
VQGIAVEVIEASLASHIAVGAMLLVFIAVGITLRAIHRVNGSKVYK